MLGPMDVILRRPQSEYPASKRSGLVGLDLLRGFTTSSEFLQLEEDVEKFDLSSRFATFNMFGDLSDGQSISPRLESDTAMILSVLTEVAVTKGVMRYSEIIEALEEVIVSGIHWYLMTTPMKMELANLICEVLKEENDGLPFRWLLELQGLTVLDRIPSW